MEDSSEFDVDTVTCLVGKNEAGKSAVLLALAALQPNKATLITLDRERDYPRRNLVQYDEMHEHEGALVIRTIWTLEEPELQSIGKDIGEGVLVKPEVEVSRRYGGEIEVSAELDCLAFIEHRYKQFALSAPERSKLGKPNTTSELIHILDQIRSPTKKHDQLKENLEEKGDERKRLAELILKILPTFMYVSSYDRMDGARYFDDSSGEED